MSYFPFFIELKSKRGLIIGGGPIAARKVETLLNYEVELVVNAPFICEQMEAYVDKVTFEKGPFVDKDVTSYFLVVAATDNREVNHRIAQKCHEARVLVNVVDSREESSFIFPSTIQRGDLCIGISTSGNSPIIAQKVKKDIESQLNIDYEKLLKQLGKVRDLILNEVGESTRRKAYFRKLVDLGLEAKGKLTDEMIDRVMNQDEKDH